MFGCQGKIEEFNKKSANKCLLLIKIDCNLVVLEQPSKYCQEEKGTSTLYQTYKGGVKLFHNYFAPLFITNFVYLKHLKDLFDE